MTARAANAPGARDLVHLVARRIRFVDADDALAVDPDRERPCSARGRQRRAGRVEPATFAMLRSYRLMLMLVLLMRKSRRRRGSLALAAHEDGRVNGADARLRVDDAATRPRKGEQCDPVQGRLDEPEREPSEGADVKVAGIDGRHDCTRDGHGRRVRRGAEADHGELDNDGVGLARVSGQPLADAKGADCRDQNVGGGARPEPERQRLVVAETGNVVASVDILAIQTLMSAACASSRLKTSALHTHPNPVDAGHRESGHLTRDQYAHDATEDWSQSFARYELSVASRRSELSGREEGESDKSTHDERMRGEETLRHDAGETGQEWEELPCDVAADEYLRSPMLRDCARSCRSRVRGVPLCATCDHGGRILRLTRCDVRFVHAQSRIPPIQDERSPQRYPTQQAMSFEFTRDRISAKEGREDSEEEDLRRVAHLLRTCGGSRVSARVTATPCSSAGLTEGIGGHILRRLERRHIFRDAHGGAGRELRMGSD